MREKRIVCFGDSNTWGCEPGTGARYGEDIRWPALMGRLLGEGYLVVEEGQCGRSIAIQDVWEGGTKSGMDYILPMIESHLPLDLLIIMLGTNDIKRRFGLSAREISGSMETMLCRALGLMRMRMDAKETKVLLVSPILLGSDILQSELSGFLYDEFSVEQSRELAYWYKFVADKYGCAFFDAATAAEPGSVDRLHMDESGHRKLAAAMADRVRELL